jgi:hypothetical protein
LSTVETSDPRAIGLEAYVYLYPLVTMELTRRQMTLGPAGAKPGHGPMGMFQHIRSFPTADFKEVVRPNFDTLYSSAWLDVSTEPVVVTAPASEGRYYMLPCYDMWTDAFACPGTRTSGSGPLAFALASPGWQGTLPDGVDRIDAPTPTLWVIGRTQTNGPSDYEHVRAFQDQLSIVPLSAWGGPPPTPTVVEDPSVDTATPPLDQVNALSAAEYFALGAQLMTTQPPHRTDWSQLARLRRLGMRAGEPFALSAQSSEVQDALAGVPADGVASIRESISHLAVPRDGWMTPTDTMGVYGNFYRKRAAVAMAGLGANQAEDAVYPVLLTDAEGEPLDGSKRYVIYFAPGQTPPAEAFWSITMYDAHGFQVANELDRFAIGDRDALTFGEDGSLDLYLQQDRPEEGRVSNWLPSPAGPLGATMRIYWPAPSVLSGEWTPPPVRRVTS